MFKPGLAITLSIFLPGAGHIYVRKAKLGILLLLLDIGGYVVLTYLIQDPEKKISVILFLLFLPVMAVYDALSIVKKNNKLIERLAHVNESQERLAPGEFSFRLPLWSLTTAPFIIQDSLGKPIGQIQRYYIRWWEKVLEFLYDFKFVHVIGFNKEGQKVVEIEEIIGWKNLFRRSKWQVTVYTGTETESFLLLDKTFITTYDEFLFEYQGESFKLTKEIFNKVSPIKNGRGKTVVELIREDSIVGLETTLRVLDPSFDPIIAASLYNVLILHER